MKPTFWWRLSFLICAWAFVSSQMLLHIWHATLRAAFLFEIIIKLPRLIYPLSIYCIKYIWTIKTNSLHGHNPSNYRVQSALLMYFRSFYSLIYLPRFVRKLFEYLLNRSSLWPCSKQDVQLILPTWFFLDLFIKASSFLLWMAIVFSLLLFEKRLLSRWLAK